MSVTSTADDQLALALMTTWALCTGRALPRVPPALLTARELIEFWAE